jgi:hypothetical protein
MLLTMVCSEKSLCTPYGHMGDGGMATLILNLDPGGVSGQLHFHVAVLVNIEARCPSNWRPEIPLSSLDNLQKIPMLLLPRIEPRFLGRPSQLFCYFGHVYEILQTGNLFSWKRRNRPELFDFCFQ